jgi:DNA-binding HxlR family transcriptional regulator
VKRQDNKSSCPVNVALEAFGDSWSLLIVRDIVFWGKRTYGEFLESEEQIATNVLSDRLTQLEEKGILAKKPYPGDSRKRIFELTGKGLDLIPIVLEMSTWSSQHDPRTTPHRRFMDRFYADRERVLGMVRKAVRRGGSIFSGPESVMEQLGKA